jgi:Bacterial membrane protein YfhO
MTEILLRLLKQIWIPAILFIPLLILLPGLGGFAYPPQNSAYSDITVSHYPNALFLRNAIFNEHTVPLWSPAILSGYPLAANPLSGLWYPFGLLELILPLPLGFNLLVLLHLLWGGVGMWLLLKMEGLGDLASVLGGLAFEAMPKLFAHFGAGHITLLYAIAWTPWLLLCTYQIDPARSFVFTPRWQIKLHSMFPGVIFALIILADVRWAVYAGILWWAYSFAHTLWVSSFNGMRRTIFHLVLQSCLGLLLSAPLILPLSEYIRYSTRAGLTPEEAMTFSLPPARLLGLIYPTFQGFHEWVLYPGIIILTLALLGLGWPAKRPATKFWLGVSLITLILSLGSYLPWISSIASIPGFDLLRVPSRLLFLTGMSLAALAASNTDRVLNGLNRIESHRSRLVLVSLAGFVLFLSLGVRLVTGSLPLSFAWGTGFVLVGFIWIEIYLEGWLSSGVWVTGLLTLTVIDLLVVDSSLFTIRSEESVLAEADVEARYLAAIQGEFRVYSPSYSLPQQTSVRYAIEMASGVDPLQLRSYVDYMAEASGVPQNGYSVAVPPLMGDDPSMANAQYIPNPKLLGYLNVSYILSGYPLEVNGLKLVERFKSTWLYQNMQARPRAWVQPVDALFGEDIRLVNNFRTLPNQINLEADGPGLLVLSEINYPGWRAWVDGNPETVQELRSIFRSIALAPGNHQVVFAYRPTSVYAGLVLFFIGVIILVSSFLIGSR